MKCCHLSKNDVPQLHTNARDSIAGRVLGPPVFVLTLEARVKHDRDTQKSWTWLMVAFLVKNSPKTKKEHIFQQPNVFGHHRGQDVFVKSCIIMLNPVARFQQFLALMNVKVTYPNMKELNLTFKN